MKINPSQRLTTPRPGGYITASMLALVAEKIKSSIKGGKGILIHRIADQVVVEARATSSGGTGGVGWQPIKVANTTILNNSYPPTTQLLDSLAVITDGAEKYGWYEIGDDGAGNQVWRPRNFWKTS